MKFRNMKATVQASTIVRLVVLVISLVNLVLSVFGTYQIPGLSESMQDGLAVCITAVISAVTYWYNNSWSENATTADKILTMLKESDITVEDVISTIDKLQENVSNSKFQQ